MRQSDGYKTGKKQLSGPAMKDNHHSYLDDDIFELLDAQYDFSIEALNAGYLLVVAEITMIAAYTLLGRIDVEQLPAVAAEFDQHHGAQNALTPQSPTWPSFWAGQHQSLLAQQCDTPKVALELCK